MLTFLTGDPGYDLDTRGGGDGGAGGGAFPEQGTDGKALTGLIWGFEALEGTVGLPPFTDDDTIIGGGTGAIGEVTSLSGDASGGLEGLFDGDCLGGNEGGVVYSLFGDTDFTVFTLALELKESLEDVKLILLRALLTCTTLSKVNFEGLGGCG